MKKFIRLDDYPYGIPIYVVDYCRDRVRRACQALNRAKCPFLLGVIPRSLCFEDFFFLNEVLPPYGYAALHGYDHNFLYKNWSEIVNTWPLGGEFAGKSENDIRNEYSRATTLLSLNIRNFDKEHYIAPFNTYTQSLLNALQNTDIKYLHTCDKEHNAYGYYRFDYGTITPVISKWHVSYDFVNKVIDHFKDAELSQITLHWMYDCEKVPNWEEKYFQLGSLLVKRKGDTVCQ